MKTTCSHIEDLLCADAWDTAWHSIPVAKQCMARHEAWGWVKPYSISYQSMGYWKGRCQYRIEIWDLFFVSHGKLRKTSWQIGKKSPTLWIPMFIRGHATSALVCCWKDQRRSLNNAPQEVFIIKIAVKVHTNDSSAWAMREFAVMLLAEFCSVGKASGTYRECRFGHESILGKCRRSVIEGSIAKSFGFLDERETEEFARE